jgi:hypothetical protein
VPSAGLRTSRWLGAMSSQPGWMAAGQWLNAFWIASGVSRSKSLDHLGARTTQNMSIARLLSGERHPVGTGGTDRRELQHRIPGMIDYRDASAVALE